jgi:hypothetical protein
MPDRNPTVHDKKINDLTGKNNIIDIKYKWSNYHIFYNLYKT